MKKIVVQLPESEEIVVTWVLSVRTILIERKSTMYIDFGECALFVPSR